LENHQVLQESGIGRPGKAEGDSEAVKRWKEGRTGVPIVDAAMKCINEMGLAQNWVIAAMYLTKDLMIDWVSNLLIKAIFSIGLQRRFHI
jgi:deoxyribodipyrimidine photo-lyase